jgi:phage baseplate assembly protein gpV
MEDTLERMAESVEDLRGKFYGVMTGKVMNLLDPMMLGRVQVQISSIDDLDLSPWARVCTTMAGIAHGTYFVPNIGDEVLVAFENGNLRAPYILGSLWNAMAPPPLPSPLPQMRMIRTPMGNTILFAEIPPAITIQTPSQQTILMSPAGIQITTATNIINMTPDGITVSGPNINLAATATVNITAPNVTVNGATATNVLSGGVCNVTAPLVKIN